MNAVNMMGYGHQTVLSAIQDIPMDRWDVPGVCGTWSVKDVIAHLASYEHWFEEALREAADAEVETPTLDAMRSEGDRFNDSQVEKYKSQSAADVLAAYTAAWEKTMSTARTLPADLWDKAGAIPWYGSEYTLNELMVYTIYAHKREHSAQIAVYHDTLKAQR